VGVLLVAGVVAGVVAVAAAVLGQKQSGPAKDSPKDGASRGATGLSDEQALREALKHWGVPDDPRSQEAAERDLEAVAAGPHEGEGDQARRRRRQLLEHPDDPFQVIGKRGTLWDRFKDGPGAAKVIGYRRWLREVEVELRLFREQAGRAGPFPPDLRDQQALRLADDLRSRLGEGELGELLRGLKAAPVLPVFSRRDEDLTACLEKALSGLIPGARHDASLSELVEALRMLAAGPEDEMRSVRKKLGGAGDEKLAELAAARALGDAFRHLAEDLPKATQ
jgi:hypothetical protein